MAFWSKKSAENQSIALDTKKPTAAAVRPVANGSASVGGSASPATAPATSAPIIAPPKSVDTNSAPPSEPDVSAAPQVQPLPDEELRKRVVASKQLMSSLGSIVTVLLKSPQYRQMPLSDLEKLVMPGLLLGQFVLAEAHSKADGMVMPVAVAMWAAVSDEVDQRFSTEADIPIQITTEEWKSGSTPWVVLIAGDQRVLGPLLKRLQDQAHEGRPLKMRARDKDGKVRIITTSSPPVNADAGATT